MAIAIDEGHFEGEDLSGLNVGLLVDIPGRMAEGNWRVAAYVDERSTQKAYNGLLKIFSGAAGGTTGLFTFLVSEIIGAERAPVEIVRDGNKRSINIGRKISGEVLPFEAVQQKIGDYLEEASWRRAVAQYLKILIGKAEISGLDIEGSEGLLVQ